MDQGIMTLITVAIVLAAAAFVLWLLYTVIWRAVRRGMQEFEHAPRDREYHSAAESAAPTPAVRPLPSPGFRPGGTRWP